MVIEEGSLLLSQVPKNQWSTAEIVHAPTSLSWKNNANPSSGLCSCCLSCQSCLQSFLNLIALCLLQSYIHGSSQAQFVAETHIVLLFSILPVRSMWLVTVFWSANAAAFSVVLCHGCNCHLTLMQKLGKPSFTGSCAFPVPLIFKLNRKIFTALSPS